MTDEELIEIIKIQSDLIERLTLRLMDSLPPTQERADLKEQLELLKEKSKGI